MRIGLVGPYGLGNLGDVAIQTAMLSNLQRRSPEVRGLAICENPLGITDALGIPGCPMNAAQMDKPGEDLASGTTILPFRVRKIMHVMRRHMRFFRHVWKTVGTLDLIIFSGGGQLDDYWGGTFKLPWSIFIWTVAGRFRSVPVALASVGWDSLSARLSRTLVRFALRASSYISFRDVGSCEIARRHKIIKDALVVPDIAYSLDVHDRADNDWKEFVTPVVGISPISDRAWSVDPSAYDRYWEALVTLTSRLREAGIIVRAIVSQTSMDSKPAQDLMSSIGMANATTEPDDGDNPCAKGQTLKGFLCELRECDVVVASRLHGVLLSHVTRTPVVAIAYCRKVSQLMQESGQDEYCIAFDDVAADSLEKTVHKLIQSRRREIDRIDSVVRQNRAKLNEQYSDLLSLVGSYDQ